MTSLSWQVTSLELAKKLRDLGIKQESVFYWKYHPGKPENVWLDQLSMNDAFNSRISAFTVAELGKMLPLSSKLEAIEKSVYEVIEEADARATKLIYLIEHGLLDANKENLL